MAQNVSLPPISLPTFSVGRLLRAYVRLPKPQRETSAEALLRLAETSPHLLEDVGLRQETDGSWSNGRHRVAAAGTTPADRLLRVHGLGF
jgi:hypothetical protein